ncbi:MAG: hypothetical protein L3J57_14840 [Desulfuromusa sp.]|nr:hypothetical protein [Desulfuromusa sp.]
MVLEILVLFAASVNIILRVKKRLDTSLSNSKKGENMAYKSKIKEETNSSSGRAKTIFFFFGFFLALSSLALFLFGPEKDAPLTAGIAANLVMSLILAISSILLLRE